MEYRKLNMDNVEEALIKQHAEDPEKFKTRIGHQQVMVYVMVGGGMIGRSHAEQPSSAYVDARVGRRPYPSRAIVQATKILAMMGRIAGMDPNRMPALPDIHNVGVF